MDTIRLHQFLRGIWVICLTLICGLIVYVCFPLIYPFIIAWAIAYTLNPLVNLLERKARFPRWLAVVASLAAFMGAVGALITLLVSRLIIQIEKLSELISNNIDTWISSFTSFIQSDLWQNTMDQINRFYAENLQTNKTFNFDSNIDSAGQKIAETITKLFSNLVVGLLNLIASLPNLAAVIIVVLLASFFIGKDWYKIKKWINSILPQRLQTSLQAIWASLQKALFGYIRAQLVMISITAVFIIIGLLILRVNYAFTIGILIGIVDLLPYLGVGAVMVPWIIYLFIHGNIPLGIGLSILYGIVLLTRQLIEPKVLATSIGLNSLAALIAMFVGLTSFGVLGLIIGPVVLVVLLSIHRAGIFRDLIRYVMQGPHRHPD